MKSGAPIQHQQVVYILGNQIYCIQIFFYIHIFTLYSQSLDQDQTF